MAVCVRRTLVCIRNCIRASELERKRGKKESEKCGKSWAHRTHSHNRMRWRWLNSFYCFASEIYSLNQMQSLFPPVESHKEQFSEWKCSFSLCCWEYLACSVSYALVRFNLKPDCVGVGHFDWRTLLEFNQSRFSRRKESRMKRKFLLVII